MSLWYRVFCTQNEKHVVWWSITELKPTGPNRRGNDISETPTKTLTRYERLPVELV